MLTDYHILFQYKILSIQDLVPDFSFKNDDDDIILKMMVETREQIVCSNLSMKHLVEFTVKLYCHELAIQNHKLKAKNDTLEDHLAEIGTFMQKMKVTYTTPLPSTRTKTLMLRKTTRSTQKT